MYKKSCKFVLWYVWWHYYNTMCNLGSKVSVVAGKDYHAYVKHGFLNRSLYQIKSSFRSVRELVRAEALQCCSASLHLLSPLSLSRNTTITLGSNTLSYYMYIVCLFGHTPHSLYFWAVSFFGKIGREGY